jgi:hypothetical protein
MKRLVDLIDRGVLDDQFSPISTDSTIFQRTWPHYHNTVSETKELSYLGNAAWGQRITVLLNRFNIKADFLQWLCVRIKPLTWVPGDVYSKLFSGSWGYYKPEQAWMWASSLGSIAIKQVEFEIGDTTIETIPGEYLDIWSRQWLDGGRAGIWDLDIYGQLGINQIRNTANAPWTTLQPTEDGYVYCWLPLVFLKRPTTPFPVVACGNKEIRVHITFRPFHEVIRMRATPRSSPTETPLGQTITFADLTGPLPIPHDVPIQTAAPAFEDATIYAGVAHIEDPLRSQYIRDPFEMIYEPVKYMTFDVPDSVASAGNPFVMQLRCTDFAGPIREICWVLRRKFVWDYNEWTNYGSLLEDDLADSKISAGSSTVVYQQPIMTRAVVMVDNAIWSDEAEDQYRADYGMEHRGGARVANGMVYGYTFGAGDPEALQPAGTVNASRATIRLDLTIQPPSIPAFFTPTTSTCSLGSSQGWVVHVFGIGLNWMRFVNGQVGPLFSQI